MFPLEQTSVPSDLSDNKPACEQWGPQGWGQDILWDCRENYTFRMETCPNWSTTETGLCGQGLLSWRFGALESDIPVLN